MALVISELRRHTPFVTVSVCASGQHRDMLADVLDLFGVDTVIS